MCRTFVYIYTRFTLYARIHVTVRFVCSVRLLTAQPRSIFCLAFFIIVAFLCLIIILLLFFFYIYYRMTQNMAWNRENCLKLIDLYKQQPSLWDPTNQNYYTRLNKQNAWLNIANSLECSVDDVKRKMESLLGSFRREKGRLQNSLRKGKKPQTTWYAFKRMKFLMYKNIMPYEIQECEESQNNHNNFCNDETQKRNSTINSAETVSSYQKDCTSQNNNDKVALRTRMKRERLSHGAYGTTTCNGNSNVDNAIEQEQNSSYHFLVPSQNQQHVQLRQQKDEFDIYGEYVAFKLRHMNNNSRIFTQKAINDVLFKADLGKYDNQTSVVVVNYNEDGDLFETTSNTETLLETLGAPL